MDKKIQKGCFRKLTENESRLLIMRHGDHKDNVLTKLAHLQALATGHALKKSGLVIDKCVSSPSPRAIETNLAVQEGYGKMMYIQTDSRLSDLAYAHADDAVALKKYMTGLSLEWNEPNIAQVIFDPDSSFFDLGESLATECGWALTDASTTGKTIFITSHGVGRIEPGLILISGKKLHTPKRLVETGQIVEVIHNFDKDVVEENWLEPVKLG